MTGVAREVPSCNRPNCDCGDVQPEPAHCPEHGVRLLSDEKASAMVTVLGWGGTTVVVHACEARFEIAKQWARLADRRMCPSNPRTDGASWEPWEGNGPCQDCGARNVNWLTTNATWNAVMGPDGAGLLCPSCFAVRAHAAGLDCGWRFVPETGQENQDYWLARLDEREKLRREGHLVGTPEPLPVTVTT